MVEVTVPEFDEDMDSIATITYWYFGEGDHVEEGEDLVEIETPNGTYTLPAPASGILNDIMFGEAAEVDIGEIIALIDEQ